MKHVSLISKAMPAEGFLGSKATDPQVPSITGLIELLTSFFNFFIVLVRFKSETQLIS